MPEIPPLTRAGGHAVSLRRNTSQAPGPSSLASFTLPWVAAVSGHTPARALSQGGEDASSAGRSTCCRQSLWAGTKEPPGGRQSTRLPKTPMPSLPWSVFIKMRWLRGPAAKERRSGPPPSAGCALPPAAPPGRGGGWVWPLAPPARLPARPAASRRLPARSLRAEPHKGNGKRVSHPEARCCLGYGPQQDLCAALQEDQGDGRGETGLSGR